MRSQWAAFSADLDASIKTRSRNSRSVILAARAALRPVAFGAIDDEFELGRARLLRDPKFKRSARLLHVAVSQRAEEMVELRCASLFSSPFSERAKTANFSRALFRSGDDTAEY